MIFKSRASGANRSQVGVVLGGVAVIAAGAIALSLSPSGGTPAVGADPLVPRSTPDYANFAYEVPDANTVGSIEIPKEIVLEDSGVDGILPDSVHFVGNSENIDFWVGLDRGGFLCLIGFIPGEEWTSSVACQDTESFKVNGAGMRFSSPNQEIEAYIAPSTSPVSTDFLKSVRGTTLTANVFTMDPKLDSAERNQLQKELDARGVNLDLISMNSAEVDANTKEF